MEHYSLKLRELLKQTADAWLLERSNGEELWFTPTSFRIETEGRTQSVDYINLVAEEEEISETTLVKRCLEDLEGIDTSILTFPPYFSKPEPERLCYLIAYIDRKSFPQKSIIKRLESYYYLGDVLTSRGWAAKDNGAMLKVFKARKTKYIQKIAKRVYALFSARGIAHLYTVSFIRSTYLVRMSETDFYGQLIPAARIMRMEELAHE